MVLDERTRRTYAALDDAALLTLLLVLRDDMQRHLEQIQTLNAAYRDSAGPNARTPATFEELFEALKASGDAAQHRSLDHALDQLRTHSDGAEHLTDPATFERFTVGYNRELAEREYFVRTELVRRNLIPDLEPSTAP
jgi:hypothetical protein